VALLNPQELLLDALARRQQLREESYDSINRLVVKGHSINHLMVAIHRGFVIYLAIRGNFEPVV
jgi:hypothetical protein